MIRLRIGKKNACGSVPGASSLSTAPRESICRTSAACSLGYAMSGPQPSTPTVAPFASSAPRCAAASTPRARPLTTTMPREARSAPSRCATARAYGEPAREPTIATASAFSQHSPPRRHRTGGGSWMAASIGGYAGSFHPTTAMPMRAARASACAARSRRSRHASSRAAALRADSQAKTAGGSARALRRSIAARRHAAGASESAARLHSGHESLKAPSE